MRCADYSNLLQFILDFWLSPYQRKNFLNGPGKLCAGLDLTRRENGLDLTGAAGLYVRAGSPPDPSEVRVGKRIGIDYAQEAVDFPWRFWTE